MRTFAYDSVDSTNAQARRLIADGSIGITPACVVAREQTAGKGSRGRTWCSPREAGIYLSVIDRPARGAAPATVLYTLAAGVACAEALEEVAGVAVELRPVNDLWVGGRKLGGILVEAAVGREFITSIVTGVGINVRAVPREVAADAPDPVSLEDLLEPAAFAELSRRALVQELADRVVRWTATAAREEIDVVRRAWAERSVAGVLVPEVPGGMQFGSDRVSGS